MDIMLNLLILGAAVGVCFGIGKGMDYLFEKYFKTENDTFWQVPGDSINYIREEC